MTQVSPDQLEVEMSTFGDAYPIVNRVELSAPERRMLFKDRRRPEQVPKAGPNEVLVVTTKGQSRMVQPQHFRGDEEEIVEATSISVVDMSDPRGINVELTLPSSSPSDDFRLLVGFDCKVLNAVEVVRRGITNLRAQLESYLSSYPEIANLGQDYDISELATVRREVAATLQAIADLDPFIAPGLSVKLKSWRVSTSEGHLEFSSAKTGLDREARLEEQRRRAEAQRLLDEAEKSSVLREKYGDLGADKEYEAAFLKNMTPAEAAQKRLDLEKERERARADRERELRLERQEEIRARRQWEQERAAVEANQAHEVNLRVLGREDKSIELDHERELRELEMRAKDRDRDHEVTIHRLDAASKDRDRLHERDMKSLENDDRDRAWRQQARVDVVRIIAERGGLDFHPEFTERVIDGLLDFFEPSAIAGRKSSTQAIKAASEATSADDIVASEDL